MGETKDNDHNRGGATHQVTLPKITPLKLSLIDRGADGFVCGDCCVLIATPVDERCVDVMGINNQQPDNITNTADPLLHANGGPVTCMFHKAAHTGRNPKIMPAMQMKDHDMTVDECNGEMAGESAVRSVNPSRGLTMKDLMEERRVKTQEDEIKSQRALVTGKLMTQVHDGTHWELDLLHKTMSQCADVLLKQ